MNAEGQLVKDEMISIGGEGSAYFSLQYILISFMV